MKDIFEMSGVERAAALMVALGPKVAAEIMKHLDEESIEKLTGGIAKIDRLSPQEREDLIGEFLIDLKKEKRRLRGGEDAARQILSKSLGEDKADQMLSKLSIVDVEREFASLNEIENDVLVSFLKDETPQTIAVAMSFLAPEKSAAIMSALGSEKSKEVALRVARMDRVMPEAAAGIVKTIKKKYADFRKKSQGLSAGGLDTLVSILQSMPGEEERNIMKQLAIDLPNVTDQINEKIYAFENVVNLSNQEIRILIDTIRDDNLIARSLKGASDEVRFKFLRNMSQNRATDILTEMEGMGVVRRTEVEDCRRKIVSIMKGLDDDGTINLRTGESYVK